MSRREKDGQEEYADCLHWSDGQQSGFSLTNAPAPAPSPVPVPFPSPSHIRKKKKGEVNYLKSQKKETGFGRQRDGEPAQGVRGITEKKDAELIKPG